VETEEAYSRDLTEVDGTLDLLSASLQYGVILEARFTTILFARRRESSYG